MSRRIGGEIIQNLAGSEIPVVRHRSQQEKFVNIVDFLKSATKNSWSSFEHIENGCGIDLAVEMELVEELKRNPKIYLRSVEGQYEFQFKTKYSVSNMDELMGVIMDCRHGVLYTDIADSYPEIEQDCLALFLRGDVIRLTNKEKKSHVYYPRGLPFYATLSGHVTVDPGEVYVNTSEDLTKQVRRGDAIALGDEWFRVCVAEKGGKCNYPDSASSVHEIPGYDRKVKDNLFSHDFTSDKVPIHIPFHGSQRYDGAARKHGCTNDVRACWIGSEEKMNIALSENQFYKHGKEWALEAVMIHKGLMTKAFNARTTVRVLEEGQRKVGEKEGEGVKKADRQKRESDLAESHNAHLQGGVLAGIIKEQQEEEKRKREEEDFKRQRRR